VGLNPRRPLDKSHRAFAEGFAKEMCAYAVSAIRREAEVKASASQTERLDNFVKLFEMTDVGLCEYGNDWKVGLNIESFSSDTIAYHSRFSLRVRTMHISICQDILAT